MAYPAVSTLFFVYGRVLPGEMEDAEARARSWLRAAWRGYRDVCEP